MATHCTITIEGIQFAKLFKWSDGHPENTLKWLEDFNKRFSTTRSQDNPEFKFAQLVRSSIADAKKYKLSNCLSSGWAILAYDDYDYEESYEYTLHRDGKVTFEILDY